MDDSVQDKRYSRFIEVAQAPVFGQRRTAWSPALGLVNLVHSSGESGRFSAPGLSRVRPGAGSG
ncbi:MAG: hypothetical protein WKG07_43460 [Hymenobacter sp.]